MENSEPGLREVTLKVFDEMGKSFLKTVEPTYNFARGLVEGFLIPWGLPTAIRKEIEYDQMENPSPEWVKNYFPLNYKTVDPNNRRFDYEGGIHCLRNAGRLLGGSVGATTILFGGLIPAICPSINVSPTDLAMVAATTNSLSGIYELVRV